MILLLHRALRNAGDYLIHERARRLLLHVRPRAALVFGDAARPLLDQFDDDLLREVTSIVIAGGPGYRNGMYPRTYPLAPPDLVPAPVVFLASGSYIVPGSPRQVAAYRFDAETRAFLVRTAERAPFLGARDRLTRDLLVRNGIEGVLLTGDPAWYDLERIDTAVRPPDDAGVVVFTPPAHPAYVVQAARLLEALTVRFGAARVHLVFHRDRQPVYVDLAARLGCAYGEIGGSTDGLGIYDDAAMHVGYRLHAHLYCLSRGTVSYLVAEDSRGTGALETLGPIGLEGYDRRSASTRIGRLAWRAAGRFVDPSRAPGGRLARPTSRLFPLPEVGAALLAQVEADQQTGFARHAAARQVIRDTLPTMIGAIETLP